MPIVCRIAYLQGAFACDAGNECVAEHGGRPLGAAHGNVTRYALKRKSRDGQKPNLLGITL